jgi:hypothetical protein
MLTEAKVGFWERHRRALMILLVPAWVVFIVLLYVKTRPPQSNLSVNTLRVGALPVT